MGEVQRQQCCLDLLQVLNVLDLVIGEVEALDVGILSLDISDDIELNELDLLLGFLLLGCRGLLDLILNLDVHFEMKINNN